jgi:hypothetical protein
VVSVKMAVGINLPMFQRSVLPPSSGQLPGTTIQKTDGIFKTVCCLSGICLFLIYFYFREKDMGFPTYNGCILSR